MKIEREGNTLRIGIIDYQTIELLINAMAQTIELLLPYGADMFPPGDVKMFRRQIKTGKDMKAKLYEARDLGRPHET